MKISEKAASAMYHLRHTNGLYPVFKYKFKMTFHLKLDKYWKTHRFKSLFLENILYYLSLFTLCCTGLETTTNPCTLTCSLGTRAQTVHHHTACLTFTGYPGKLPINEVGYG